MVVIVLNRLILGMNFHIKLTSLALVLVGLIACKDDDQSSNVPFIKFLNTNKKIMKQGDLNQDSLWLSFSFEDGDGDLGFGSSSGNQDIFLIDKRTDQLQDAFKIPDLPDAGGKPISGNASILIFTTCCLFPNNIPPCSNPVQFPNDSLRYELYIKDRAGHESNHVISDWIVLSCK